MWPFKIANDKDLLTGFVPDEVADLLISGRSGDLAPKKHPVTVFFSDIYFVRSPEDMTPADAVDFLKIEAAALGRFVESVRRNHGIVDNFIGPMMMALWNVPRDIPNHQTHACLAALDCIDAIEGLRRKGGLARPLRVRIGINSGVVVAGLVQYGSWRHYTAFGGEVNLASRLEGANKFFGTRVLVSEAVFQNASDIVVGRSIGKVRVMGERIPVQVFELLGRKDRLSEGWREGLPSWTNGLDLFNARKFREAVPAFQKVLQVFPEDGPAGFYLKTAEDFSRTPPEAGWDGVFNLLAK
ncbi:MAG: adenylate/guanylate cyclase domain-containing protein [Elusimicrobia bacterium]|nr:adenylate/guanylate cyclase domain-containing protein [Elusimicrobiota bacterium]